MSEYIASVDIGTTNIKINLFNSDYQVVDMVKYPHLNINQDDTVFEMDFEEIWDNVLDGIKHLIIVNEVEQLEIILTTAMHSVQLINEDGTLSGGVLTWADTRGAEIIEQQSEEALTIQYNRTGTPIHSMNPYFKLMSVYEKGKRIGSLKDLLFYRLTGEWVIDISNASSSGLLNLESLTWDAISLADIGLETSELPRIEAVDYNAKAMDTLFKAEVSVTIGTSDGISSNYVFSDLDDVAVLSIGTSHAVRVINKQPQLNNLYQNFAYHIKKDQYLIGLPSNNGADVLSWTNKIFNSSFDELNRIAAQRPQTESVFVPYLNGERAPIWDEGATGNLFALTRVSSRESVLFSIILGMIFNIKHNVSALEEIADFSEIGLVGGVTELDAFPQLIADILGYKLYIPTMKNAETLGSIAVVKDVDLPTEYRVIEPISQQNFDEVYKKYLDRI
ncbi:MAG: FGGY family carbohydrate kinase [Ruoffia tabacinasalis]|uniref:FGGY family carbohydrate kinase n=1 Tax=unclassified Ruoffia TaxID=2862149 RepID=UPI003888C382